MWLVEERESGQSVGQVGLVMQEVAGLEEPEIGYLIHRPFWRRGYALEAALGVRNWALGVCGKPLSLIRPVNEPSPGVARKRGMTPERLTCFRGLEHFVFAVVNSRPQ